MLRRPWLECGHSKRLIWSNCECSLPPYSLDRLRHLRNVDQDFINAVQARTARVAISASAAPVRIDLPPARAPLIRRQRNVNGGAVEVRRDEHAISSRLVTRFASTAAMRARRAVARVRHELRRHERPERIVQARAPRAVRKRLAPNSERSVRLSRLAQRRSF